MKTTFNLAHFSLQNTPAMAQKIGNLLLVAAGIGTMIIGLPATLAASGVTGFILPPFLLTIAKICIAAGIFGKIITKMVGTADDNGKPLPTPLIQ